ncbi:uncharacterized protein F4822DRAFT_85916 [Hypoxylon trugodes]|uniref:uncharacterized protein n=1 Tax=Hypoxylon trugodes TaxID=326681 RepID=UPI00218FDEC4|nr:uncharacterized protein F4822DRAFT_85916 [Hypoxylon trugodes]KAI1383709.1 hypothetical protein F4822DRAFT_85916 [Hypoxylon trugodes]
MGMSGWRKTVDHGTKRKHDGDGPEMRGTSKNATTMGHHAPSATTEYNTPDTKFNPKLPFPRDDDYYKTLYTEELDFGLLGRHDPELNAVLDRGSHLDFTNPKSVMQLTKTLLRLNFGLLIDLPTDRLCPPVPNRHNYILWLKDLLDSSSPSYLDRGNPAQPVTGLDIGTGANLIYPLLGCAQRPSWSFIATDVDAKSLACARKNVELNGLQTRIRVVDRVLEDCLIPLDELGLETIDFAMVNPPFYTSEMELADLAKQKSRPPNSACTGAPIEMVCAGGEVGFVRRIIDESLVLRRRVQWYTSMLGKQSSLEMIVNILKQHGVDNYAVTAFIQGKKTRRWAVGWSFESRRPSLSASRGCEPSAGKKLLPCLTEVTIGTWYAPPQHIEKMLRDTIENLDLVSWTWDQPPSSGLGFVDGNVWGRAYRRQRAREQIIRRTGNGQPVHSHPLAQQKSHEECAFGFSVAIQPLKDLGSIENRCTVVVRWLQGNEYAVFESFTGFLRKSMCSDR